MGTLNSVTQEREAAIEKARKVFRLGVSTQASGEKEKSLAVLVKLCRTHQLLLSDLDPQFPGRLDLPLLRAKIGLDQATATTTGASTRGQQPQSADWEGTPRAGSQRSYSSGTSAAAGRTGRQKNDSEDDLEQHLFQVILTVVLLAAGRTGRQKNDSEDDLEEMLFRPMGLAERKQRLQGPMFSRAIFHVAGNTRAHLQLLGEIQALNASNVGAGLHGPELATWFEAVLTRTGFSVPCRPNSKTLFDDFAACFRAQYLAETEQKRRSTQRRKAEADRRRTEEAKQQAERTDRERKAAEQRKRAEESRRERAREAAEQRHEADAGGFAESSGQRQTGNGPTMFTRSFNHPAEAQLYCDVVCRQMGECTNMRSFIREQQFCVEFSGPASLGASLDWAYREALHDIQTAAATIRAEAARVRDEAFQRAEAAYAEQCAQAFQMAVERSTI